MIGQLLIQTPDFGVKGDSGACVYAERDVERDVFPVGVFVGKFNDKTKFAVSPAEIMNFKDMNGQTHLFNKATHQQQSLFRTVIALQMFYIFVL